MSVRKLWRISVRTTAEAEDAVSELLSRVTGVLPSSHTDFRTGVTRVSVFLHAAGKRDWMNRGRLQVRQGLQAIRSSGLALGPGTIVVAPVPADAWQDSWKRHFKVLEISSKLLIKPSWSKQRAKAGQSVIVLDPGLSFGTGQHPTTIFCLRRLALLRRAGDAQSCLDIGTGSGILAIAAAKLGYTPVDAFDFDPDAVRIASENARRNGVSVDISRRDLTRLPVKSRARYTVVCANLIANLLLEHRERILARVAPGGALLLAGILHSEFESVRRCFEKGGLRLVAARTHNEWRSGLFRLGSGAN